MLTERFAFSNERVDLPHTEYTYDVFGACINTFIIYTLHQIHLRLRQRDKKNKSLPSDSIRFLLKRPGAAPQRIGDDVIALFRLHYSHIMCE